MKNRKHARRVKRLSLIVTLCAIILVVSTYAWFIGMRTVSVNTFDVKIAATDGLTLSLDGKTWAETVTINQGNYFFDEEEGATNVVYKGNTNTWGGDGLVPLSTVGEINTTDSRLVMYEKGSLTATKGGYRLLASKIDNTLATTKTGEEGTGFVAFDLFIKNLSGNAYYAEFDTRNEEAIYLTQESKVEVVTAGLNDAQAKTGIENSVRVAFAQIGRVEADGEGVTETIIQGITCTGGDKVTGVCSKGAQIWEPNDTNHVTNAVNWYKTSCLTRTGAENHKPESYDVAKYNVNGGLETAAKYCYEKTDAATPSNKIDKLYNAASTNYKVALPTYAISRVLTIDDNVDVYDGAEYNTYTANTTTYATYSAAENKSGYKLVNYPYFTDTNKNVVGTDRPQFMTLAPNSITKVRVYIWLEGQDIDNYDFAQLGKTISVNFGFTKERFRAEENSTKPPYTYDGPDFVTSDNADIKTPEVNS